VSSEAPQTLDVVGEEPAATPVPLPGSVNAPRTKSDAAAADGLALFEEERGSHALTADGSADEPPGAHMMKGDPLVFLEHWVVHTMNGRAPDDEQLGAHVVEGDPLLSIERRAVHARNGRAPAADQPRGGHVMGGDPLASVEGRAVHARNRRALADEPRGAHVVEGDPLLSVEGRAVHAMKDQAAAGGPPRANLIVGDLPTLDRASKGGTGSAITVEVLTTTDGRSSPSKAAPQPLVSAVPDPPVTVEARATPSGDARAMKRPALATKRQSARATARRRWRLVPLAGAAGAVAVGLGAGSSVAIIVSQGGSGSGQTTAGGPVNVAVAARTGNADLLPGRTGAAYFTLHNTASSSTTFDQVVSGARVVSDNTGLCASSNVSIAQTLPYSFSPAVTVSPGGTSGTQFIPALVKLAPNAPNTCQGVTFTVTFTLSGRSS
jgi:hypothetical protein